MTLGPHLTESGADFGVWAPRCSSLAVRLGDRVVPLERDRRGVFRGSAEGARDGDDYLLLLDGRRERPDPRSRFQPEGPHGPSRLVDLGGPPAPFTPPALRELVFYELHCGTFTPEGTFDAAAGRLGHLADLGVNAVEVMPVAAFPGRRGWGYDGVGLYAVHAAYGGPAAFRRFVDACHAAGLAVVLDVVYNHLGPDGNYLAEFGPYFTDRYRTPWGAAVNLDGSGSALVREFVLDNAWQWVAGYGVDGLRLDAVHRLHDGSPVHLLRELADRVHQARPGTFVVAEADPRRPGLVAGHGLDAIWADDLHHAVHVALTGETAGYYQRYQGLHKLAEALRTGWVSGGGPPEEGWEHLVVCSQNHDQVGNRAFGERLRTLAGPELDAVASVLVATSPFLPLLFQGQEWGETRPFLYFTDHRPDLAERVRRGRRAEFAAFSWSAEVPDPNDPATFERSRLDWSKATPAACALWRDLLRLRREVPALGNGRGDLASVTVDPRGGVVVLERGDPSGSRAVVVANLASEPRRSPVDPGDLPLRLATRPPEAAEVLSGASAAVWAA